MHKLSVPNRNEETLVSNTPGIPDISIHHELEIKGGLLELKRKGLKITEYKEDIPKPRRRLTTKVCPRYKSHLINEISNSEVFGVSRTRMHVYNRIEKGIWCLVCGYRNIDFWD